jgi:hypothetical protein
MTALLWLWQPSSPHHIASSPEEALDWCIRRLEEAKVPIPQTPAGLRRGVLPVLRSV